MKLNFEILPSHMRMGATAPFLSASLSPVGPQVPFDNGALPSPILFDVFIGIFGRGILVVLFVIHLSLLFHISLRIYVYPMCSV